MPSTSLPPLPVGARFAIVNLGCKVNRVESDMAAAALSAQGGRPAQGGRADLVVVNTCTVTAEADKKTRKAVRRALRTYPGARVVVTGCAAAIDPGVYEAMDDRISVVSRAQLIAALETAAPSGPLRVGEGYPTRVNIKAQDGCDRCCTYCIVHVARGPARSRSFRELCEEVRRYADAGTKEVVLAGIDLGSYRSEGRDLAGLLAVLRDICQDAAPAGQRPCRIRVSSVEPVNVTRDLEETMAESDGLICRHLHLPLQSGSTEVLGQMGRPYAADDFEELARGLYRAMPGLALTTDIICGFPGETEAQFQETLELARRLRFAKIHVFPYSARAGTPAAERSDQVPPEVKERRAALLRQLGEELRRQDRARRAGTVEWAVVEPDCALTESYHELPRKEGFNVGEVVSVRLP